MHSLLQDIRFGIRMLAKSPGFTAIAIGTLALGIGANTAIFSMLNALLLRPLPIHEPERVVQVFGVEDGWLSSTHSYPSYRDVWEQCDVFSGLCMCSGAPVHLGTPTQALRVEGSLVSGNYFAVLGIRPAAGRLLTPGDDATPGSYPVVVVSYALWQRLFQSDPAVIGSEVALNGYPFTIIGVAAKKFSGTTMVPTDLWAPVMMHDALKPERAGIRPHPLNNRERTWLNIVGRIGPSVTIEQAEEQVSRVFGQISTVHPDTQSSRASLVPVSACKIGLATRARTADSMGMLMIAVGLVLLIACANVANLLMTRTQDRQREFAIRAAVGAGRGRIIRQLLTESVTLALLAGVLGLILSAWLSEALQALIPESRLLSRQAVDFSLDARVLWFTLGISLLTGVLFGLAPALRVARIDLIPALKARSATAGRRSARLSLQSLLTTAQIAGSLALLIAAGLLLRTLTNVRALHPGFDPDRVLLASLDVARQGYDERRARWLYDQLLRRTRALPDVSAAALADRVPVHSEYRASMDIEGHETESGRPPMIYFNRVSPDYFTTMGIPLLRGRGFAPQDSEDAPRVAVVNEALARRYWSGAALGKTVRAFDQTFETVGVVADGKYHGLREEPPPFVYFSLSQRYDHSVTLAVRTVGSPAAGAPSVQAAVRQLDPTLPVFDVKTLDDHLGAAAAREHLAATLFSALGTVAVALVAVGLYGVMSYTVTRRVQEIGVRMALGARRGDVFRLILRQAAGPVAVGIALGLAGALASARVLQSRLWGVAPTDPTTFVAMTVLVITVASSACFLPARRATKVDPMIALRCE